MKNLSVVLYLHNGNIVSDLSGTDIISDNPVGYAVSCVRNGADSFIIFDLSSEDNEHEENLLVIRDIGRNVDAELYATGNIKRVEDVKKIIYAGCKKALLDYSKQANIDLTKEVSRRFGKNSIGVLCSDLSQINDNSELIKEFISLIVNNSGASDYANIESDAELAEIIKTKNNNEIIETVSKGKIDTVALDSCDSNTVNFREIKKVIKDKGFDVSLFEAAFSFDELKKNSDGHVAVVVQDYESNEVLMVAYMNEEAYNMTIDTGIMTYYSRSRDELWIKGETSGHYQYVKELLLDCDNDTILAKVKQVGNACHTGSYSCFFKEIAKKDYETENPMKVFEDVYNVILDRKENPKEGSYTNYLFDKGIDKILKKVGEEATEIVIAAKNPGKEEVKYEIADFLYHMMVLMAECGLDWKEVTTELANR